MNELNKRTRWNVWGFIASIPFLLMTIGLIYIAPGYKQELMYVVYAISVFLVVAIFAIIRRNVKRTCNKQLNK